MFTALKDFEPPLTCMTRASGPASAGPHRWRAESSSTKKITNSVAAARAEPGAAVAPRIERPGLGPSAQRGTGEAAFVASASAVPTSALLVTGAALQVAPNILSIAHGDRLLGGALYAPLSRVDWATLLRRTFDVDVTRCTGCAGRMTVRAVVTDPASIDRLLAALRRARPTRRRLTSSPLSNARGVAPWPPPVRRSPSA